MLEIFVLLGQVEFIQIMYKLFEFVYQVIASVLMRYVSDCIYVQLSYEE